MSEQFVYGVHAVAALLTNQHRRIETLYVNQERIDSRIQDLLSLANQQGIFIEYLTAQAMNQQFGNFVHQGVVAKADKLPEFNERHIGPLLKSSKSPCLILILDGVTDPHNLGACLRTADGAGVDFVIIPKDKSANITPVVSKVACGAAEFMPLVRVTNLARVLETLKQEGVWIYGAAGEATTSIYALDHQRPVALVMGAEGKGLRRLTREHCDSLFSLPMLGSVSSLNVSVAAGVCLYEIVRQRL
ncbi:23S rRNA (guanosine(2251)-2'-O)-methyltransferase RlmB [Legionella oakridgensis]|uniref:23S rRNA (guanosine-2'-O-)-methyltransferase RlmB n=2 Tax=Legionella oakridgensis TaxID=29423 RepID=W0BB85_9GAMM|nr:23S rRNA (guanosine(2251)-2'-O)-methyltransferase RlmB [Legionella oakridgensis]AHE65689.1 rRNA methylase, putative, group 3 [Legionella oakridgensis ATCC 33761 = DSM 21215]KTD38234.1 tRNA/rRNA methyltransferase [Legionella oakridgensis]STY15636.1 tRNA/rRNA methyltransferase [Legionella longbeachae]